MFLEKLPKNFTVALGLVLPSTRFLVRYISYTEA